MVLALFVDTDVSPAALWRPLAIALGVTIVLQLALGMALRHRHRAATIVAGVLLLLRSDDLPHLIAALVLVLAGTAAFLWFARVRHLRPTTIAFTRLANAMSLILVVTVVGTGAANGSWSRAAADLALAPDAGTAESGGPNIYALLLDGYPRGDTLQRLFGYDNKAFTRGLRARAFEVADHSRSNYMFTELTLASMFQMRYLDAATDRERDIRRLFVDNPVIDRLRAAGYGVHANATPWEGATLRTADQLCGDGDVTNFEMHLMRSTLVFPVLLAVQPEFLADLHRRFVRHSFACLDPAVGGPAFHWTHVPSPHLPIVFEADGTPADTALYSDTAQELGLDDEDYAEAYVGQVAYVNRLVLEAVDRIVAADPSAVIVVFSDHGSESRLDWSDGTRSDLDERFGNLFAARTPGHECLFGDAPTLVNVFPRLLNAYLDTRYAEQSDKLFISTPGSKLALDEIPNPDSGRADGCPG